MNDLRQALDSLLAGRLVVIPTDTVYGVAAVPANPTAVRSIFSLKGRPADKALPVLGADLASLRAVASFDERAERLAGRFWPGPLTLVLPRAPGFDADLGGDPESRSVAVRVPGSELARSLLADSGPLAVTSANLSGDPDSATVEQARAALGDAVSVYLDGGPSDGIPSTVVSLIDDFTVLREGALSSDEVLTLLSVD